VEEVKKEEIVVEVVKKDVKGKAHIKYSNYNK